MMSYPVIIGYLIKDTLLEDVKGKGEKLYFELFIEKGQRENLKMKCVSSLGW